MQTYNSLTVLLHAMQEFHDDLGARSDEDLALPRFLGVVDGVEGIIQDAGFDHVGKYEILNSMGGGEVSVGRRGLY